jgi:hypothetical protein
MFTLLFTFVIYGLTMTADAGKFETSEMCDVAAHQLSGPNWVGSCRRPVMEACLTNGTAATGMVTYGNTIYSTGTPGMMSPGTTYWSTPMVPAPVPPVVKP